LPKSPELLKNAASILRWKRWTTRRHGFTFICAAGGAPGSDDDAGRYYVRWSGKIEAAMGADPKREGPVVDFADVYVERACGDFLESRS